MRTKEDEAPAEVEAGASSLRSELDTVSHDICQQPLPDPAPFGRGREQAQPDAARATGPQHAYGHRLFSASGQSSNEGLKERISPGPK